MVIKKRKSKIIKTIAFVILIEILVLGLIFQVVYPKCSLPNANIPFENLGITSTPLKLIINHGFPSEKVTYNDIDGCFTYTYDDIKICDYDASAYYRFHTVNLVYISYTFKASDDESQDEIFESLIKLCDKELLDKKPKANREFVKTEEDGAVRYELGPTCFEDIIVEKGSNGVSVGIEFVY